MGSSGINGDYGDMAVGAVAKFPEGWFLAPRDRLPKEIKAEMKTLSWAPYSKEMPNAYVVGPMPGKQYENMILPVLAPIPDGKEVFFGKAEFKIGVNRGRGQVYPDGSLTNDNVYVAKEEGGVKSIEEKTGENGGKTYVISIEQKNGIEKYEIGAGADVVVEVGDQVDKDTQLTTNPNVGGFAH